MPLNIEQSELRNAIASAAQKRSVIVDGAEKIAQTSPEEWLLHRTRYALIRTRRLDVAPVQPYKLDPELAAHMAKLGLVKITSPKPEKKTEHVIPCELTDLGRDIRDTL